VMSPNWSIAQNGEMEQYFEKTCTVDDLIKQSKVDFINECSTERIADWVLNNNHLDLFCKEVGYLRWRKAKRVMLKMKLLEDV